MRILIDNKQNGHQETAHMPNMKWSIWNDIINMPDGRVVIFNTRWHTAVLLSEDEYYLIRKDCRNSILRHLGMAVNAETNEELEWREAYHIARHDMSYLDITVVLTEKCQFGCVYCFEGTSKATRTIDNDVMQAIMRWIEKRLNQLKRLRITWFGGEPMLAYEKMKQMSNMLIPYCKEHGICYTADITTNGFTLNPLRISEMVDSMKIGTYIITLDGTANVHNSRRPLLSGLGTFDKIWENIATLIKHDVFVLIRITIDKKNIHNITALINQIAEAGWAGKVHLAFCRTIDVSFTPKATTDYIYTENEFADVEWQLIQYAHQMHLMEYTFPHAAPLGGCLRDGDIVIGPGGEIYKCLDTIGDERWVSGNIADWEYTPQAQWLESWNKWKPNDMPKCRQCTLQPLCSGGCPHNALFRDKKHGTTIQCPDWKANYKRNIIALINEISKAL